ncbi:MAG: esterase-like activity of phytase family protein [Candidatus Neomarinimicrobiota bacterium]
MKRFGVFSRGLLLGLWLAQSLGAQAVLVGYARLPADSFRDGPPSTNRPGLGLLQPKARWQGQPVQGVSSLRPAGVRTSPGVLAGGSFWALSDNGFGAKTNSASYLLCIYRLRFHWRTVAGGDGSVELEETVELRDPHSRAGFPIEREEEAGRRLTGADFDPESMDVAADGSFWIGEEFGPYLLHFSAAGKLLSPPIPARVSGAAGAVEVRSPDRAGGGRPNLGRSKGFEGLTLVPGGGMHLLLEGPLKDEASGRLRLFSYEADQSYVEATAWRYPLERLEYAIGELTYWAARETYLVVERDWGHGRKAEFKRLFGWRPGQEDGGKSQLADLLDIADPHGLAGEKARFSLPYVTIEAVHPVDERTVLVCNDNNYPATGARSAGRRDDTEFVLLQLEIPDEGP